jgi:hypothetical protein
MAGASSPRMTMKVSNPVFACLAAALAGSLAAPSTACARDAHGVAPARAAARQASARLPPARPKADPLPARLRPSAVDVSGVVAQAQSAAAAAATTDLLDEDVAAATAAHQAKADGACMDDCQLKPATDITVLPQTILRNLGEMPIVGEVLITPVTRGYTVVPAEGLPALTFTVKPTKITRGSGLVAFARF